MPSQPRPKEALEKGLRTLSKAFIHLDWDGIPWAFFFSIVLGTLIHVLSRFYFTHVLVLVVVPGVFSQFLDLLEFGICSQIFDLILVGSSYVKSLVFYLTPVVTVFLLSSLDPSTTDNETHHS